MIIVENVAVYHEGSGASQYHFNMLKDLRFDGDRHYYGADCLDQFIDRPYKVKLAGFHVPFPTETGWLDRISQLYEQVDHIYLFCSELHHKVEEQLRSLDRSKITMFVNGNFRDPFTSAKILSWMDWFVQPLYFYKELHPGFLDSRLTYGPKALMFDALLGAQRAHRDFVFDWVNSNGLSDQVLMTYYHNIQTRLDNNPNFVIETEGMEIIPNRKFSHSIDQVVYHGYQLGISCVVPLTVYNQTNYSIVAETNFDNHYNFYTEKIVKPIMCKRLFVAVSGQHYLKNLRSYGFKTFDGIIDESYDLEPDNQLRWQKAMQQVKWLCKQDPAVILEQIKDIVEHNHCTMFERDWYAEFSDQLAQEIRPYLQGLDLRQV
jgi:hypothetical protein